MKIFRRFVAAAALIFSLTVVSAVEKVSHHAYVGAIVIDAASGQTLFEDNADEQNPPASMTKLMTYAVLSDKLASGSITLQTPVRITIEDAKMGGTQVYLDPRETFSVEELIYAMMIQSANDAAHALARASGGSVEAFVALMNAKAHELGMTRTVFRTPHGLPPAGRHIADGDLTSPRDYAVLCRHLVMHTDVLKYTAIRNRDFGPNRKDGPQHMKNHNNLLGKVAGVDGLKTGYTAGAGYCLSATAERNGRRVIAVIMGSMGPNGQVDKGKTRDLKAVELIEQGFADLPAVQNVKTAANPAPAVTTAGNPTAKSEIVPTVTTDKSRPTVSSPTPAPNEQSSTAKEPMFKLNIPSSK